MSQARHQFDTPVEEWSSACVHGLGALLAVVGAAAMLPVAARYGDALHVISLGVFGVGMIGVYGASTLLHLARAHLACCETPTRRADIDTMPKPRWRRAERVLLECDHTAIYLLIAGTYTPMVLLALGGTWGWAIFVMIWMLALAGVSLRLLLRLRHPALSLSLYLVTGWIGLIALVPIVQTLSPTGLALVFAGGAAYTTGVVFFLWQRLAFNHAIWHAFVVAGTACHFAAMWHEVVPTRLT